MPAGPTAAEGMRQRATSGAALLAIRSVFVLALGVGANIVLARLLEPRDFGLVALGSVMLVFGGFLTEAGLGAALVRRPEPPTRAELEAVNGLQIAGTAALALAVAAVALPLGRDGFVVATMVAGLPITVLRTPSVILLERQLTYRTIATVDVIEAVAFYAWSITAVALGMGVWGMATGLVFRALAGTSAMARLGPIGLVRPRWAWALVRPLVAFGAKLQAISVVAILREQGLNIAIAAIAGVATLGVWNLAFRVLQAPTVIFATVGRVSFPAMSRLLAAGRDPGPVIERGVATLTVVTGAVLVALVGFAPALPALVGHDWREVPPTLALSAAGILAGAPIYVLTVGYLYATDRAGSVLRSMIAYAACWLAVTMPLLPALGAPAVAVGWMAGATVNATLLARAATRHTRASIAASFLPPAMLAAAGGAAGWLVASAGAGSTPVPQGILGAAVAEAVLIAGLALARRSLLRDAWALVSEAGRGALRPPRPLAPEVAAGAGSRTAA